jgi:hypothetical protein
MKTREIKKIYYIKDVKYFYQVFLRNLKLSTTSFVNEVANPSQADPLMFYQCSMAV